MIRLVVLAPNPVYFVRASAAEPPADALYFPDLLAVSPIAIDARWPEGGAISNAQAQIRTTPDTINFFAVPPLRARVEDETRIYLDGEIAAVSMAETAITLELVA